MKHVSTTSIILKRINFSEADRILTVITPDHGKISLLAKGSRKSKSKLAGGLELFSVANITFIDGKTSIKTVVSTQLLHYYSKIVENIETTMLAYEFLKLTDIFTQETCDEEYFELLKNGLEALHVHDRNLDLIYSWYINKLLYLSGSAINVETQADGHDFDENAHYNFSYDDMAFVAHTSGRFEPKHIKFLRLLNKVSTPENLIKIGEGGEIAKDLKPILENCCKMVHH